MRGGRMKKIESGNYAAGDINRFQALQWAYARRLVTRPLRQSVQIRAAAAYTWPKCPCQDLGRRKDNDYKSVPVMQ